MKTNSKLFLIVTALFLSGCFNDPRDEDQSCPKPQLVVHVNQQSDGFTIYNSIDNSNYGFYEVQYGPNGFKLGEGTVVINSGSPIVGMENGPYDVYMRGNCGGGDWSQWGGPSSFLIEEGNSSTCPKPTNLRQYYSLFRYKLLWDGDSRSDYYEIEYGPTGFTIGNGTLASSNSSSFSNGSFTQGITYDFYVRGNCGGSDWSPWAGPSSFYAEKNANRCLQPLGITANRNGSFIEVQITPDGEDKHEVSFNTINAVNPGSSLHTQNQSNGTYGTFSTGTTYYVWARSICEDGSRTAWTGPAVIN